MRKGYLNKIPIVAGDANKVSTNIYYKENPDGTITLYKRVNGKLQSITSGSNDGGGVDAMLQEYGFTELGPSLQDQIEYSYNFLKKYNLIREGQSGISFSQLHYVLNSSSLNLTDLVKVFYLPTIIYDNPALEVVKVMDYFPNLVFCDGIDIAVDPASEARASFQDLYGGLPSLREIIFIQGIPDNCRSLRGTFAGCQSLQELPFEGAATSKITDFYGMLTDCASLNKVELDFSSVTESELLYLTIDTTKTPLTITDFKVSGTIYPDVPKTFIGDMPFLSRESLLSVLNALHDYSGGEGHSIYIPSTSLAKLTEEDKKIASSKNWTIESGEST